MKLLIKFLKVSLRLILITIFIIVLTFVFVSLITEPSNNRNWNIDQAVISTVKIDNNLVSIKNIRNFTYASTTSYTVNYYDKTFDINKIKKVWYVVEPFSGIPGSAHTFLSFEFEGDQFVSISVEIRKEKGETYSPIKGLFNMYELMYVIADERDVINLRANHRKDLVYLYPINAKKEKVAELFLDMVNRVNKLNEYPEFYNTITNTCTTNIVEHVNKITPKRVPFFSFRILLPANSDKLAYELGLIDTDLPFEQARVKYFINYKAMKYINDPNFSVRIREED